MLVPFVTAASPACCCSRIMTMINRLCSRRSSTRGSPGRTIEQGRQSSFYYTPTHCRTAHAHTRGDSSPCSSMGSQPRYLFKARTRTCTFARILYFYSLGLRCKAIIALFQMEINFNRERCRFSRLRCQAAWRSAASRANLEQHCSILNCQVRTV